MATTDLLGLAMAQGQARDATDAASVREMVLDVGDATDLGGAEAFEALESLTLHGRKTLSLRGLGGLRSLRTLIVGAYALKHLEAITALPLRSLELLPQRLADLRGLASDTLLHLRVWNTGLKTLEGLRLPRLRRLDVSMNKIADLAPLAELGALRSLDLQDNPAGDLAALAALPELRALALTGMKKVKSLEPLRGLSHLSSLVLTGVGTPKRDAAGHVPRGAILDAFARDQAEVDEPVSLPWGEAAVRAGWAGEGELEELDTWEPSLVGAATWAGAAALRGVRTLRTSATEFAPISELPHLTSLLVRVHMDRPDGAPWTLGTIDFSGLARAERLSRLIVQHPLSSLASLPTSTSLRHLEVASDQGAAISIDGIERFSSLATLTVVGRVLDQAPLARTPHVRLLSR